MPSEEQWLAVKIEQFSDSQRLLDVLFDAGSLGVHEDGSALVTHFPPGTDVSTIEQLVRRADPAARVSVGLAPQSDWTEWQASVRSHHLGRVTVTPPWLAHEESREIQIVIDPEMAFGTGEHATTRGVIRLMQQLPEMPDVVADLGAGSAILAICAARLGAQRVAAIELDADAIGNAESNVRTNGVEHSVTIIHGDAVPLLPLVAPVGLVVANIISSVLIELLPTIGGALTPSGFAILSGILVDERPRMLQVLESGQWSIVSEDSEDEWWSVLIAPQR